MAFFSQRAKKLPWAFAFYLAFAVLTVAFPLLLRVRSDAIRAP